MHTCLSHAHLSVLQVGMDKSVTNLMTPLTQLQEEIMVTYTIYCMLAIHSASAHVLGLGFTGCMGGAKIISGVLPMFLCP